MEYKKKVYIYGMISKHFFYELIAYSLKREEILKGCLRDLQLKSFPSDIHRTIWRVITKLHQATGTLPTLGGISQECEGNEDVTAFLDKIEKTSTQDETQFLGSLDQYVKLQDARDLAGGILSLFKKDKEEEVVPLVEEYLTKFKGKGANVKHFDYIYKEFEARLSERLEKKEEARVPFFIDCLDIASGGGIIKGDTALFCARSGGGKTKILRWIGASAARVGLNVLHIQAEGTKQECILGYESTFTGYNMMYMRPESGVLQDNWHKWITNANRTTGDVAIYSFDRFHHGSMKDIHQYCQYYLRQNGCYPDLILIDYLDVLDPRESGARKYEHDRFRRQDVAEFMKNLAVECNAALITATQASSVPEETINKTDFVLTVANIAESKALINSFSYFITLNASEMERESEDMRIYIGKNRHGGIKGRYQIKTNFAANRFYDKVGTLAVDEALRKQFMEGGGEQYKDDDIPY